MAMAMAKNIWVYVLVIIGGLALSCNATTYIVGDTSGWDISTDLDAWSQGKRFYVGDVLGTILSVFIYIHFWLCTVEFTVLSLCNFCWMMKVPRRLI